MHQSSDPFKKKDISPRDLRTAAPGAGNIYPVDPAAVERLNRIIARQDAKPATKQRQARIRKKAGVRLQPGTKEKAARAALTRWGRLPKQQDAQLDSNQLSEPEPGRDPEPKQDKPMSNEIDKTTSDYPPVVPEELYPASAIYEAEEQMRGSSRSRRLQGVFTPEVCAVFWKWKNEGRPLEWIAKHNGLVPTTLPTLERYMRIHQPVTITPTPLPSGISSATYETSQTNMTERNTTAIQKDTLGQLLRLLQQLENNRVDVTGELNLNLDIKINF